MLGNFLTRNFRLSLLGAWFVASTMGKSHSNEQPMQRARAIQVWYLWGLLRGQSPCLGKRVPVCRCVRLILPSKRKVCLFCFEIEGCKNKHQSVPLILPAAPGLARGLCAHAHKSVQGCLVRACLLCKLCPVPVICWWLNRAPRQHVTNKCLSPIYSFLYHLGWVLHEAFARTDIASIWLRSKIIPGDLSAGGGTD